MQGARLYDAKDTTCKTKRYYIKTYLALVNVPMWYYGFKPCFLQILPITYANP